MVIFAKPDVVAVKYYCMPNMVQSHSISVMNTKKTPQKLLLLDLNVYFIESTLAYNNDRILLIIGEFSCKGYVVVSVIISNW